MRTFKLACENGNLDALMGLLDPDATVVTDGGGRVRAAFRPITGAEKVARYFLGVLGKQPGVEILEQSVNGQPGLLAQLDGTTVAVIATNVANDAITHLWIVMNPDKLRSWTDGAYS